MDGTKAAKVVSKALTSPTLYNEANCFEIMNHLLLGLSFYRTFPLPRRDMKGFCCTNSILFSVLFFKALHHFHSYPFVYSLVIYRTRFGLFVGSFFLLLCVHAETVKISLSLLIN